MTSVELVPDGTAVPFRYHWKEGVGAPVAGKLKTTVLPLAIDWEVGWVVAVGAEVGPDSEITVAEYGANDALKVGPAFEIALTATSADDAAPGIAVGVGVGVGAAFELMMKLSR